MEVKRTFIFYILIISVSIALSVRRGVRRFHFVGILIALPAFIRFHGNQK